MINEEDKRRDDFWDVDKLVPKKKSISPFSTRPAVVDYAPSTPAPQKKNSDSDRLKLTFSSSVPSLAIGEDEEYCPEWNPLIARVKIKRRRDRFDFFEAFRKAAALNYNTKGEKCRYTQFYSYMPQYSQFTPEQRDYYFYWRSEVREGRFLKTDYSYLYLMVYEIFNLPDFISPTEGLELLVTLWREYRKELPRIDLYFSIWVQDYCLVYKLPCPQASIADFIFNIIPIVPLREFYLYDWEQAGEHGIAGIISYLSDYDFTKGKYVLGNPDADEEKRKRQSELYKVNMINALKLVLEKGEAISSSDFGKKQTTVLTRDAFTNSVCTSSVKCSLEIEYHSLADMSELRAGVTAAMRYSENRMRGIMGVKSRLSVKELPAKYKDILEPYFDALEKSERKLSAKVELPEYERLYSAPREKLSSVSADIIESASWITTARLVSECEDEAATFAEDTVEQSTVKETEPQLSVQTEDATTHNRAAVDFVSYLLDPSLTPGYVPPIGFEADVLAEEINAEFMEALGDIILEKDADEYGIIEDYREEVKEWLSKTIR